MSSQSNKKNGEVPEIVNNKGKLNPKSIANLMANLIASRQQNPNSITHRQSITRTQVTTKALKNGSVKNKGGQSKKPNKVNLNPQSVYPSAKLKSTHVRSAQVPKIPPSQSSSTESDVSSILTPPDSSTQTEFIFSPSSIKSEFMNTEEETIFSNDNNNGNSDESDNSQPFATVLNYDQSPNSTIKQEEEEQMEFKQENEPMGFSLDELEEEEQVDVICRRCDNTHFLSLSAFLVHLKFCRLQNQCRTVEMEPASTNFDFEVNDENVTSEQEYLLMNNHNGSNLEQDPLLQPVVLNVKSEVF